MKTTKHTLKYRRAPYNPNRSQLQALERRMALTRVRTLTRHILISKHDSGELRATLESFMFESVRGDVLPTIAEGYAQVLGVGEQ